jgi:hypothetical protein
MIDPDEYENNPRFRDEHEINWKPETIVANHIKALEQEVQLWKSRVAEAAELVEGNVRVILYHHKRVDRLEQALREIADMRYSNTSAAEIARKALEP